MNNLAQIYFLQESYDQAKPLMEACLTLAQELDDLALMGHSLYNAGAILVKEKHMKKALSVLIPAYGIFLQIDALLRVPTLTYLMAIQEEIGEERFQELMAYFSGTEASNKKQPSFLTKLASFFKKTKH